MKTFQELKTFASVSATAPTATSAGKQTPAPTTMFGMDAALAQQAQVPFKDMLAQSTAAIAEIESNFKP
jgi:hypothetical protein